MKMTGEEHRLQWVIILDIVVILGILIGSGWLPHANVKSYPAAIQMHGEP